MKLSTLNKLLYTLLYLNFTLSFNAKAFNLDNLTQTQNLVQANDKYVTLLGTQVAVGEQAPNFKVVDKNFSPIQLSDFKDQTVLISVVPSLDTGVCSIQTKRFNEEAGKLPSNITLLTISNDLPFAQKRFCKVENVDQIKVLSDSVWRNFGESYGLIIKDMGLLTRAIFIIDSQGIVKYKELVANISQHPNYANALKAVKDIAPVIVIKNKKSKNTETADVVSATTDK
jgi:thiol peroxidase